ncbi:MAG: FtsX-like permease family protein [Syntrophorhabdaceae bacterium]
MKDILRAFLRYLIRRKSLSVLQLLGISFGVAAVVGMTLASQSALNNLDNAVDFLKGGTSHTIARPAGSMEESLLHSIMNDPAVKLFSPVIDGKVRLPDGEQIRMLGVDPFLDRELRAITAAIGDSINSTGRDETFLTFLTDPRAVLVDETTAKNLNVSINDVIQTTRGEVKIVHIFPNPSGEPLIVMDIGHAQTFLAMQGIIDRIDLVLIDENGFRERWAKGFIIESNREKTKSLSALLGAFKLNLQALSLLALFVGIFLIYNTAMFAVVSRRKDAGILLSIGASRSQVTAAFLIEVLIFGITGGALGAVMGYALSKFLVTVVGGTISTLYFFLRPSALPWSFWNLAGGIAIGCGASIIGCLPSLVELGRVQPVEVLRGRTLSRRGTRRTRSIALSGALCLVSAVILFSFSFLNVYIGFAGAFAFLLGGSLFSGLIIIAVTPAIKKILAVPFGLPGKMAAGSVRGNLGRTSVAVAAFMVALSMSIGLSSMIGSFRESLVWWMNSQLRGDMYISTKADIVVPEGLLRELQAIPGIGGIDIFRSVSITFEGKPASITSIDAAVLQKYTRFGWLDGNDGKWENVKKGEVIISESFARRFDVKTEDTIRIEANQGPVDLLVAGIYYDYVSEHGVIMMDRTLYISLFGDRTINSLGIFIDKGNPRREIILDDVKRLARKWGMPFAMQADFHKRILTIFDSTFAVTRSMRIIAIIVAFFGITGALMTLFAEKQKEFGIYRALGFTTSDVARMTIAESLALGLISFIMSIAIGTVFSFILIKVINLQSFNWTIFYHFSARPYIVTFLTAMLASLAACAYPVWSVIRKYPVVQIRED